MIVMAVPPIRGWRIYWSSGRVIAVVLARTEQEALRKSPEQYHAWLQELKAVPFEDTPPSVDDFPHAS